MPYKSLTIYASSDQPHLVSETALVVLFLPMPWKSAHSLRDVMILCIFDASIAASQYKDSYIHNSKWLNVNLI